MAAMLTQFIARARGRRLAIVDYLNMRALSRGDIRYMADLCARLPDRPIIVVTKKEDYNGDDYAALTATRPNILVIVCGDRPQLKVERPACRDDYRASADDHMIALLVVVLTTVGCAPIIFSADRFRDSGAVFANIPEYVCMMYANGMNETQTIASGRAWIDAHIIALAPHTGQCALMAGRRPCSLCLRIGRACPFCGVCFKCRLRLTGQLFARLTRASQQPESTPSGSLIRQAG